MNTKLHAVADANGRPLSFFMTAGQVSDYTGAAALLDDLPKAQGYSVTAATTPTGLGTRSRPKASRPASRAADRETSQSDTTSDATGVVAALRSCSAASTTGDVSPPATTVAPQHSSPPSPLLQPSSSGSDQSVLTLKGRGSGAPMR
jgi:transposase